jgi:hypothetical protein
MCWWRPPTASTCQVAQAELGLWTARTTLATALLTTAGWRDAVPSRGDPTRCRSCPEPSGVEGVGCVGGGEDKLPPGLLDAQGGGGGAAGGSWLPPKAPSAAMSMVAEGGRQSRPSRFSILTYSPHPPHHIPTIHPRPTRPAAGQSLLLARGSGPKGRCALSVSVPGCQPESGHSTACFSGAYHTLQIR